MAQSLSDTPASSRQPMGAWVSGWHVGAALLALAVATWELRDQALGTLRSLATDKAYFSHNPLLFDGRRLGYSVDVAREHMAALGNAAMAYYADTYIALYDLAFPLLLLMFGVLLVLYATQPDKPHGMVVANTWRWLLLVPAVALFVLDMVENLMISTMLDMYPSVNGKLVETASGVTQVKWLAAMIDGLVLLGLAAHVVHRLVEPTASPRPSVRKP